jgi:hypothetical protein
VMVPSVAGSDASLNALNALTRSEEAMELSLGTFAHVESLATEQVAEWLKVAQLTKKAFQSWLSYKQAALDAAYAARDALEKANACVPLAETTRHVKASVDQANERADEHADDAAGFEADHLDGEEEAAEYAPSTPRVRKRQRDEVKDEGEVLKHERELEEGRDEADKALQALMELKDDQRREAKAQSLAVKELGAIFEEMHKTTEAEEARAASADIDL